MKITLQSTARLVRVNGAPARVWEGKTEAGIPIAALVTQVVVDDVGDPARLAEFERDLNEHAEPSPEVLRMFPFAAIVIGPQHRASKQPVGPRPRRRG